MNDIKVHVSKWGDRRALYMFYRDPDTGRKISRSTKTSNQREAERAAAKWEADLQEGRYVKPSTVTWEQFRELYETEHLPSLKKGTTERKVAGVLNAVEKHISPRKLADLTTRRVSQLQSKLRESGLAESTIKGHMAHLQAALNWAKRQGLLITVPEIEMPKRAKRSKLAKGRPITAEEFERMLDTVPKVVGAGAAESWCHYLRGLWFSGLRLAESLQLWWDRDDRLCVDLSGKYPMLRIPAELEKGHQDRLLPISPEFSDFLLETLPENRTGRVFDPRPMRDSGKHLSEHRISRIGSLIGKAAGVKVHTDAQTGKVKYGSLHDLRRAFGERWAKRVMPPVLKELMRHESIETTLRYYVGLNAESVCQTVHEAVNSSVNRAPESSSAKKKTLPESDIPTGFMR